MHSLAANIKEHDRTDGELALLSMGRNCLGYLSKFACINDHTLNRGPQPQFVVLILPIGSLNICETFMTLFQNETLRIRLRHRNRIRFLQQRRFFKIFSYSVSRQVYARSSTMKVKAK